MFAAVAHLFLPLELLCSADDIFTAQFDTQFPDSVKSGYPPEVLFALALQLNFEVRRLLLCALAAEPFRLGADVLPFSYLFYLLRFRPAPLS
jgi:hypothetical protein